MRRTARVLGWFVTSLLTVIVAVGVAVGFVLWATLPARDLRASIPGLQAPVTIDLDADGIPRIRAGDERDAVAALGFVHARDRMFQMDLMRRNASGRLSEIAGALALPQDRFMRTLGLRRAAEADLTLLPADTRDLLDAYARGVNAWIALRGRFAAPEFLLLGAPEPWTAVDSLLWGKTMSLYLAGNWRSELARLALAQTMSPAAIEALWPPATPRRPDAQAQASFPADAALRLAQALPAFPAPFTLPGTASNAWAVDGARSATGRPLLAGDPHLGFGLPGIWYLARIAYPGHVLVGATSPGVPMLVLGHNGHIAWTFTTTGADTQDLFIETPAGPGTYRTPDGPAPFQVREERIRVRGGPDVVLNVRSTRHGPVISDLVDPNGPILALSAAELSPGDTAAAGLVALNHATTVAEAGAAAAAITAPVQNLTVADRDGIAMFVTGRVPLRRAGDGTRPQPGADGAHDWTGFASADLLPRIVAPASGHIVTANEPIASATFLGADGFDDFRARRILALLGGGDRHTVAEFAAMQMDVLDPVAQRLLPRLKTVAPPNDLSRAALAVLAEWNGVAAAAEPAPLIFNAWMSRFADLLLTRLGVPPDARAAVQPWPALVDRALSPSGATLCGGDCDGLLRESLAAATASLAEKFGSDPSGWRWGRAHQAVFAHPLLRFVPVLGWLVAGRVAAPGDETTIDAAGFRTDSFAAVHGPSFRAVYDLADLDRSLFVAAPGQSGNPLSGLARNLLARWRDGRSFVIEDAIGAGASHIRLEPTGARP